jgi:hypothetical protein
VLNSPDLAYHRKLYHASLEDDNITDHRRRMDTRQQILASMTSYDRYIRMYLKGEWNLPKSREQCLLMPIGELTYLTDWLE